MDSSEARAKTVETLKEKVYQIINTSISDGEFEHNFRMKYMIIEVQQELVYKGFLLESRPDNTITVSWG